VTEILAVLPPRFKTRGRARSTRYTGLRRRDDPREEPGSETSASRAEPHEASSRGVIAGRLVELQPLTEAHAPVLRALHASDEVVAWWGRMAEDFPWDDPGTARFAVVADGEVAGMVQWGHERDPAYRHAWIDVFLGPAFQGRGYGSDAVEALARHLHAEERFHRIVIDPAVDNVGAVRAYEKAGFRRIGVAQAAWRDVSGRWRDVQLMERVELDGASAGAARDG
jgi:aminoglycoside 6'-N-acetyltransferase